MKVAFVLPMPTTKIVGGYKIVYEYANSLTSQGHEVTIFFNSNKGINSKHIPKYITFLMRNVICRKEPKWFNLSPNVKKINLYSLDKNSKQYFKKFDTVIATAAETASFVNSLDVKQKVYLIQGFEKNWRLDEKQLFETYNYPNMKLVVVSKWLMNKVSAHTSKKIYYIPNGIDKSIFGDYKRNRNKHSIAMLYHLDAMKAVKIGFKVIYRLKQKYPDLEVNLFGAPKPEKKWPSWIHYTKSASPKEVSEIMNKSSVFLCTSRKEGFGLTGLEAMFCGCILVTTDCGGIREYANTKNALICKVDDVENITNKVVEAFENMKLRNLLKKEALNTSKEFYLSKSEKKFLQTLIIN